MQLVGAYINDEKYGQMEALAAANKLTLAGLCRQLFDQALAFQLQPARLEPPPRQSIMYRVWAAGGNRAAVSAFCGEQPACPVCADTGAYEGELGPKECTPCCSRLFFFVDAEGMRRGADDGDIIEKDERGLYLIRSLVHDD